MGRSKICPYIVGEVASHRHARRKRTALKYFEEARAWAKKNGFELTIHNDGHHWVWKSGKFRAEWWPSSARLVVMQRWDRDWHMHDHKQVQNIVRKQFRKEKHRRGKADS